MKWVRKNTVVQPQYPTYTTWERAEDGDLVSGGRRYRKVTRPTKPYRSYSKWHIAHDKSQWFVGGRVISLCGTLNLASQDIEVSEDEPKKGKKGYGSSAVCSNCAMVWRAIS